MRLLEWLAMLSSTQGSQIRDCFGCQADL